VASNEMMAVNKELGKIWKEPVMYLKNITLAFAWS
jgi:hypothetical protein